MPGITVGEVTVQFNVGALTSAKSALDAIAKQIDELNKKKVSFSTSTTDEATKAVENQKKADKELVKSAEEAMARRARLDRALTQQTKQESDARLKTAQQNDKMEAASAAEKAKLKESYEKAWTQAVAENAKRDAAAAQQSSRNWQSTLQNIEKGAMAPWKAMQTLSNSLAGVARGLEHTGQIAAIFGYRMALVAAPLYALGAAGGKAAIDLETSVKRAATQLDDLSPANIEKFTKDSITALRQLSTEFPKTADDMADALYYLVSTLTVDPKTAQDMVEPITEFATATKSTALTVSQAVAPVLNVYKQYADSAGGVSTALSIMFETIRRGKGEASDIARQFGDFLAYGKTIGATLEQQASMFALLTRVAGSPSEAATQMSALFRGLTDSKATEKLKEAGVEVTDVNGDFLDLFIILKNIKAELDTIGGQKGKVDWLNDIFPNVRAERGVLSLFTEGAMADVEKWASEMESATGRVSAAAEIMGSSVESQLTKMQGALMKSTGELFDTFIKDKLLVVIQKVKDMLDAFNNASPQLKEMLIQFVLLATAAGPASLAFGTLIIALSQAVSLIATLVSPLGLIGVAAAMTLLKEPLGALTKGLDTAGGGMQGMAKFAAALAVELGLVKQTDAVNFMEQLGIKIDLADFLKIRKDAEEFVKELQKMADEIKKVIDFVAGLAKSFTDNWQTIAAVVGSGLIIASLAKIALALGTIGVSLGLVTVQAGTATAAIGSLKLALLGLPPLITITLALVALGSGWEILDTYGKSWGIITQSAQPGGNAMTMGGGQYNNLKYFMDQGRAGTYGTPQPGSPPTEAEFDPYWWSRQIPDPWATGAGAVLPDYTPPDQWMGYGTGREMGNAADVNQAYAARRALPGTKQPGGGGTGGVGGTRPPTQRIMTPQEMAPGIFAKFAGAGWSGAFAQQHGGQDPFSFYQSQGYSDPMGAALRDKAWGDEFAKKEGRAASQGDWEQHWYETYKKQEVPELDAEGKPTGRTKTVIGAKSGADEFTKMVEEAMKGITDKKQEVTDAYKDPPQALIDKKQEITDAYLMPIEAFKQAVLDLVAWLQSKFGFQSGNTTTTTTPPPTPPGGPGPQDYGGPVVSSGVHRLLKGEYVLSMPEQRDIRAIMAGAGAGSRGGDSINVNINGANANPREIAVAVMAEIQWQKGRRSGKMVY